MHVYDISDPAFPVLEIVYESHSTNFIPIGDNRVVVLANGELYIVDLHSQESQEKSKTFEFDYLDWHGGIAANRQVAYISSDVGIFLMDITRINDIKEIIFFDLGVYIHDLFLIGKHLLAMTGENRLLSIEDGCE